MKKNALAYALILTLALLASSEFRARATAAWQVFFNGQPSELKVVNTGQGPLVAVGFHLPPKGQEQSYSIRVRRSQDGDKVEIDRVLRKHVVRDAGDCPTCSGSGDCQECYPPGSKKNTSGLACLLCNATGDCYMCTGSGKCYVCGGAVEGCNNCRL